MAWEWTGTLGLAGMFFTWLTAKQGRDHERLLAAEAREQQRLEKTYIDLLDMVQRAGQWVQFVLLGVAGGSAAAPCSCRGASTPADTGTAIVVCPARAKLNVKV